MIKIIATSNHKVVLWVSKGTKWKRAIAGLLDREGVLSGGRLHFGKEKKSWYLTCIANLLLVHYQLIVV